MTLPDIPKSYLGAFLILAAGLLRKFGWVDASTFDLLLTSGLALLGVGLRSALSQNQTTTEAGAAAATQAAIATTGAAPPSTVAEVIAAPPASLSATVAADALSAKGKVAAFKDDVAEGVRDAGQRKERGA